MKLIRRYVEQILSLYNYIDGLMIVNKDGIVEYYNTFRPDLNNLQEQEVLGKHLLEVYPTLTEESSSLLKVLKNHQPIYNESQYLTTFKGQSIYAVNSTLPIKSGDEVIGAVDISRYIEPGFRREDISLSLKQKDFSAKKVKMFTVDDIVTNHPLMLEVKDKIRRVADTNSTVLIYGKTGTGKELVAQAIHSHSKRNKKPFISQNCAAIPSTLLEGILFGTVKGSYTGAENRQGLFELAQGGTFFLDEINSMEISMQAKLLKAIEEKKIWKVGGTEPINIDTRIISAVNEEPKKAISEKNLRADLFYRLGVVQITVPTLKERRKDINLLTNYFINQYNQKMKRNIIGISEGVEAIFHQYSWPGNVRELQNVIEGAFNLTSHNLIEERDLPNYIRDMEKQKQASSYESFGKSSLNHMVEDYEKQLIIRALNQSNTKADAAKLLKISKQSLKYKMDKYNL